METEYLGYAAGLLTTFAFVPQAYRMIRTRQVRDISLSWAVAMTTGSLLWLCYGIARESLPMIAANGISLVLLSIILALKIRHS
ncbi:MAG: SemiSWEET transporter [Chlorobiaceae bacterium]|nr:SemiSWEET transporter [Chlorobiales bacterium]NTU91940.1 SemiSWEET transporter [Chlorobiaceae bacterium]NTV24634.1 SemiSWEET transporter [Chlorobiaceae bacterium]